MHDGAQLNERCTRQIVSASGDVIITNDGATIVKRMEVQHAAAQMVLAPPSL